MIVDFLSGASCVAALTIALFFLRFWRDTDDRLFAFFALAFAIFAVNRALLTFLADDDEARTMVYGLRALAFAFIAYAIVDKNRPAGRGRAEGRS